MVLTITSRAPRLGPRLSQCPHNLYNYLHAIFCYCAHLGCLHAARSHFFLHRHLTLPLSLPALLFNAWIDFIDRVSFLYQRYRAATPARGSFRFANVWDGRSRPECPLRISRWRCHRLLSGPFRKSQAGMAEKGRDEIIGMIRTPPDFGHLHSNRRQTVTQDSYLPARDDLRWMQNEALRASAVRCSMCVRQVPFITPFANSSSAERGRSLAPSTLTNRKTLSRSFSTAYKTLRRQLPYFDNHAKPRGVGYATFNSSTHSCTLFCTLAQPTVVFSTASALLRKTPGVYPRAKHQTPRPRRAACRYTIEMNSYSRNSLDPSPHFS